MTRLPLHLDLTGRAVLVVGAGPVGRRRAAALHAAGALVTVVAPEGDAPAGCRLERRRYAPTDVEGAWLVFAATGTVDDLVAADCEAARVWCVRADDATRSPAWVPAVGRVDDVVLSVSAGADPRRAVAVRDALLGAVGRGEVDATRARPGAGRVALVGGGPGDPGLLTVRGRDLLATADLVVRDRLAPQVELGPDVEVVEVGKSPGGPSWDQRDIEALLVDAALAGRRVVRLKGGDPYLFARGAEEVAACAAAGVPCEVVPGVSSAFAAPGAGGVPVTALGATQSVTVVSAHVAPGDPRSTVDWAALARLGGTLVLLMAVPRLGACAAALVAHGLPVDTPVAVVERGTLPDQRTTRTTLGGAGDLDVQAPAVVVIGAVAA